VNREQPVKPCAAIEPVKPDPCAGLLQRNLDTAEVRGELHSCLGSLQGDRHIFFIPQVNASDASDATDKAPPAPTAL
jgi:hypothetical protein